VFGIATGWLGWPPSEAWASTVPEIDIAVNAKIEWVKMTTPGAKKEEKPRPLEGFFSQVLSNPGTKVYGD
jgi:hypothetical protein